MRKRQPLGGALCLLGAALVWGFCFVAQDLGARYVDAFTFQATRNILAVILLGTLILCRDAYKKKKGTYTSASRAEKRMLLVGGTLSGIALCVASALQQLGIANNTTSPGKDAFVTALYIVMVPVLGLFLGKRAKPHVYACVGVALFGLWMLCMSGSTLSVGDIQVICCAMVFAVQIVILDHYAPRVDGVKLAFVQFFVVAVISTVPMLLFERPTIESILLAKGAILYAGIGSTAVGYTLQILGQRSTPSTVASLIMSLESVFAVLASAILLPELTPFSGREVIGMVLIFAAIIVSQLELPLPGRAKTKKQN